MLKLLRREPILNWAFQDSTCAMWGGVFGLLPSKANVAMSK